MSPSQLPTGDPAHDILQVKRPALDALFAPKSVAVIGATDRAGSVGRTILWNLISNPFGGTVYPVNPKSRSVLGIKAYPSVADLPEPPDLAVVVTPAPTVPAIIGQCAASGITGAIIISAGFKEIGADGVELERQILAAARHSQMRLIGPNCLGLMSPRLGLNATFAGAMARSGNVGFISQSGALCTAVLDWSLREHVGFSAFVSIGSMLDVGWGDLIDYLGNDPHTHSIVLYMEAIGDARAFLSAAREVALTKPIIVIKAGRTEAAAKAAASHTGALSGSDAVLDAAFRRCGVLRLTTIGELFNMAQVLAKQPRPRGPRLTILTNAGGPGVLATDALIASGGVLASLAPETVAALDSILPTHWSHANPIDILGDADPQRYIQAIDRAANDPNSDGMLVVLTPQAMTEPTQVAELLRQRGQLGGKPLLASWMGGVDIAAGEEILNRANIPTFPFPDTAARAFTAMWRYSDNLRSLYETPALPDDATPGTPDRALAEQIVQTARSAGRTLLNEAESKQLLAAYDIPTVQTRVATSIEAALDCAAPIGYPVVLKLFSATITHKTDVGGVQLNLADAAAVRQAYRAIERSVTEQAGAEHFGSVTVQPMIKVADAYELILGASADPQFGPVLLFGSGGQLVEVFKDHALGLPPLTTTLARRMMEQTRIYTALKGVRGRAPIDLDALAQLLVRFSQLIAEQRWVKEIDINPLLAAPEQLLVLDARVVLYGPEVGEDALPRLAIRPYPTQYVTPWALKDGTPVTIRPIRPEDEPLMVAFHETLSEQSVYLRYFSPLKLSQRIAHERLTRICFIDYARQMALVVERRDAQSGQCQILGVGRLIKQHGTNEAEYAIVVSDQWQGQGLGTQLLRRLIQVGRDEGLSGITAEILPDNRAMQQISQRLGFQLHRSLGMPVRAVLDL
ncbi:MAG: bifunctional acetate--CoA ligase family protein/GNAT family N-acetyltransferase [Roseiflexaceae bacterium]